MEDLRLRFRRRKPPERQSTTYAATLVALNALKQSADAFPPLKSAVGGVLAILELCNQVKSNQEECQALGSRVEQIMYKIADAVPDATQLSPDLLVRIEDFTRTLHDIQAFMENHRARKFRTRLFRHKEVEGKLTEFKEQLGDAYRSFTLVSSIKIEMTVSRLEEHDKSQELCLDVLSEEVKRGHEDMMQLIHRKSKEDRVVYLTLSVLFN